MVVVECIKCKNKVPESELFITDGGRVTKICVSCVHIIINNRIEINKGMKKKIGSLKPMMKECSRCGVVKLWPMEFPVDSDRCIGCSRYKTDKIINSKSHRESVSKWREKYPEKYEEQKKRNRERVAMMKKANPEKFREKNRIAQVRRRERLKYIFNTIDRVEHEYKRLTLEKERKRKLEELGYEGRVIVDDGMMNEIQTEFNFERKVKKSKKVE